MPLCPIGYAYPNGNGDRRSPDRCRAATRRQGLTSLDKETGQGLPALDWTYGAHGVIVEVDPETGEYKVIKIASAFDVGKVINPGTMRGQCIGGMIQGLGTAECESYIYDEQWPPAQPVAHRQQDPHLRRTCLRRSSASPWRRLSSTGPLAHGGSVSTR